MSLTQELKDSTSRAYRFLHGHAPILADAGTRGAAGRNAAAALHFDRLKSHDVVVSVPPSVTSLTSHSTLIGTAFDYRARMMLDVLYPRDTVAYRGLSIFCSSCPHTEGGNKLAKELTRTFQEAEYLYASNDPVGRDTAAIIFAWCESMRRNAIPTVMESRFGHQFVEVVNSGGNLIDVIDPVQLSDLQALRIDAEEQISEWRKRIVSGAPYEPNPIFSGSGCVGGADADWIIDDTLIDCKTTKNLTNSWIRKALFQLLGYSLLDFTDYFEIRNIGLWLPRFRAFQVWNIYDILDISSKRELQKVRREFEKALTSDT